MLKLPAKWQTWHGGYVAVKLLEQIECEVLRRTCMGHFVGAALDLLYATFWHRSHPECGIVTQVPGRVWSFGRLDYRFYASVDDDTFDECARKPPRSRTVTAIVPPNYDQLLQNALRYGTGRCFVHVWAFDTYVAYRVTFAALDAKWTQHRVMCSLLEFYNARIAQASLSAEMRAMIPKR